MAKDDFIVPEETPEDVVAVPLEGLKPGDILAVPPGGIEGGSILQKTPIPGMPDDPPSRSLTESKPPEGVDVEGE